MLLFFVDIRVPSLSVTEFTYFRKYELLFAADFLQKAFFLVLQLTMCCYKTYEHHQHKQKKQKFQRK